MTTTLHLTSVDMTEFSEAAVRYFVDAAYSGEPPVIPRELFRDVNKIANVFKMSWLVTRCVEQFCDVAEAIKEPIYEDLLFLFEEAAFVLSNLKLRQLVSIALDKIRLLDGVEDFIKKYFVDFDSLSFYQLDLIIELAETTVHHVVQPLIEIMTARLSGQEAIIPINCKYIIDNIPLYKCQQQSFEIFEKFFDAVEKFCRSQEDAMWVYKLYRKSSKTARLPLERPVADPVIYDNVSSNHVIQYSNSDFILNLYNTLDPSLKFNEIADWLGKSEKVISMAMFLEGLWTWMWLNKEAKVVCTEQFLELVCQFKRIRNWNGVHSSFLDMEQISADLKAFFDKMKKCKEVCSSSFDDPRFNCNWLVMESLDGSMDNSYKIESVFTPQSILMFRFKDSPISIKGCSRPDDCGCILKTIGTKDGIQMVLCTDPSYYTNTMHFHSDLEAKDMHLIVDYSIHHTGSGVAQGQEEAKEWFNCPISWLGRPGFHNGGLD